MGPSHHHILCWNLFSKYVDWPVDFSPTNLILFPTKKYKKMEKKILV